MYVSAKIYINFLVQSPQHGHRNIITEYHSNIQEFSRGNSWQGRVNGLPCDNPFNLDKNVDTEIEVIPQCMR